MMNVDELLEILNDNSEKFNSKSLCYFRDEHGDMIPFDYVEFSKNGSVILSNSENNNF